MPILFLPTIQLYKIKLTCRLPPQWGLPELPSDAPQETPKPAGKKPCHDFSILELRRSCLQYIVSNSKSPTAETRSRPAVACCAKWPQSGGVFNLPRNYWTFENTWKDENKSTACCLLLCCSLWSGGLFNVWEGMVPPIIGFARIGGRDEEGERAKWALVKLFCENSRKTRQNEFWATKSWIIEPYGPDFEELMHCNELLWLIVQLLPCLWFPSLSFQGIALLPSWAGNNVNKLSRTFKVVMTDYDDADDNYHNDGGTSERAPLSSL